MKIFSELEAYRDRLMEKAAAWPETGEADLLRDLDQSLRQVALLEKSADELRRRLDEASAPEADRIAHRLAVQQQTRELAEAYATVLKRHLEGRVS